MKSNRIDVLGLGSVTVDFVGEIEGWPEENTKKCLQGLSIHDGGLVGTALAAVARLGGKACFAGKLGSSDMARQAINALEKDGVDTSFVISTETAEPILAFVFINSLNNKRNIFWTRQNVQYPFPSEFPDEKWHENTGVLLVDFESGLAGLKAAKVAAEHGIPVVLDIEQSGSFASELMASSSHVIISEDFAFAYTGKKDVQQMLKALKTSAEQTVIITRGENGCTGLTEEKVFELPAFKVDAVDTTGCGDVFHGAYALAISRRESVIEAARFASAAAALCATKIGGRDGIPTEEELDSFIKSNLESG